MPLKKKVWKNKLKSYLPAPLCKWHILPMPIHLHWVAQLLSDVLGENEPFSSHWTAGKTCPVLHDKIAIACVRREKGPWVQNACESPERLSLKFETFTWGEQWNSKATLVTLCSSQNSEVLFWSTKVTLPLEKLFSLRNVLVVPLKYVYLNYWKQHA